MASIVGYTKAKMDTMIALLATLVSPAFTGNPTAPTPTAGDNDTSIATTAFVTAAVTAGAVPLAPKASPVFTGNPTAPTPSTGDNDTSVATTAFVIAQIAASGLAPTASPVFTGDPQAPTPAVGDSDVSIATTAFVQGEKLKLVKVVTFAAYTLIATDSGKALETINAAIATITVPPDSSVAFPEGTLITITQTVAAKTSVAAGAGVTINSPGGLLGCRAQWSTITLRKRSGANTWMLSDDVG